jgi:hypothetical protein
MVEVPSVATASVTGALFTVPGAARDGAAPVVASSALAWQQEGVNGLAGSVYYIADDLTGGVDACGLAGRAAEGAKVGDGRGRGGTGNRHAGVKERGRHTSHPECCEH